jgi:hypothetical protein
MRYNSTKRIGVPEDPELFLPEVIVVCMFSKTGIRD